MRLLDVHSLKLKQFIGDVGDGVPEYAILSHVWGDDEVSFQEMNDNIHISRAPERKGLEKIFQVCDKAKSDGHDWVWIDTCCIDKTSSAELSEAINSMFNWYRNAMICYAYLADVGSDENPATLASAFRSSKWFTRGWTLQELLAPYEVAFLSMDWREIGTKYGLSTVIADITLIDKQALITGNWADASVAAIMSWAAKRRTTRVEDEAYSLMGLFDINMPLIYGEGRNAFYRLQLEIMKSSDDQSIFAWTYENGRLSTSTYMNQPGNFESLGMLATSPRAFDKSSAIVDSASHREQRISFDIEKQFIRLRAATTNFGRWIEGEQQQLIPIRSLIEPTIAQLKRRDGATLSIQELLDMTLGKLTWKDIFVVILRCRDKEGYITILTRKTADGNSERVGNGFFSWFRATDTEEHWDQTLYIGVRAQQKSQLDRGRSLRLEEGGGTAIIKTFPGSGYYISQTIPASFTPSQGKVLSNLEMALVSQSIRKAIGVVTPLILFFSHDQPEENPPFAIRFDRVGTYGSYYYRFAIRVGVSVWDKTEHDEQELDDAKEKIIEKLAASQVTPEINIPVSKDIVFAIRYRKTAPESNDYLNMSFEKPLSWQQVQEDLKETWPIMFAHNFGDKAMDPMQDTQLGAS
jgi:hypothetical protein